MTSASPAATAPLVRAAWWHSLRWRLLAATVGALSLALLLAGWVLAGLFRQHVQEQFRSGLQRQLDQLTRQIEIDAAGRPVVNAQQLSDPRWTQPYSGLYWQVDRLQDNGHTAELGVLRSRSLWDQVLQPPTAPLQRGAVHAHELDGPNHEPVLLLERRVQLPGAPSVVWRLLVAGNLQETHTAVRHFAGVLAASLGVLLLLLVAAAWAQVAVGLRPLRSLQRSLQTVQQAHTARLEGQFPTELQPLVDDFNRVLAQNEAVVARSRTHAGNLAHALKTPLSVLQQAAHSHLQPPCLELAQLVQEQTQVAQRQIDWHLAHARAAAVQRRPGQRTEVQATVQGLVRVMQRVHAARDLAFDVELPTTPLHFAGEAQDLHEILGNLIDNACKWAQHRVTVRAQALAGSVPPTLQVVVADDGPGLDATQRQQVLARGVRLDESVCGSGLGLAIAQDLIELYGGRLELQRGAEGGLEAQVLLPATGAASG